MRTPFAETIRSRSGAGTGAAASLASAVVLALSLAVGGCSPHQVRLRPPLRFLLLGDSLMGGYFGLMLEQRLNGISGVRALRIHAKSTGLSEYTPYDWPEKSHMYIARYKPDVLVVTFGANDCLALRLKNGRLLYFQTPGWREEYAARVAGYLSIVSPLVKKVYFVGQPSTDHAILAPRYPVINRIFSRVCATFPNVTYIPAWELTCDHGAYTPVMKDREGKAGYIKWNGDPIHHTPFGGIVLAELFLDYIKKEFPVEN